MVDEHGSAFTGGVGIAEEWCGDARNEREWRDTHLRVEGPAVDGLQSAFIQDWAESGRPLYDDDDRVPGAAAGRHVDGADRPRLGQPRLGRHAVGLPRHAQLGAGAAAHRDRLLRPGRRLPRDPVRDAPAAASRSTCCCPGRTPTSGSASWPARRSYARLVDCGVQVWTFQPSMMHAKVMTVDGYRRRGRLVELQPALARPRRGGRARSRSTESSRDPRRRPRRRLRAQRADRPHAGGSNRSHDPARDGDRDQADPPLAMIVRPGRPATTRRAARVQVRLRDRPVQLAVGVERERVAGHRHLARPAAISDVVALDVLPSAQRDGEAQPRQRPGRGRDDDVEQPVVRLGVRARAPRRRRSCGRWRCRPSAPAAVVHDRAVEPPPAAASPRSRTPASDAAHGVRRLAEPVLQRARLLGRLGADAEVHGVDDDAARRRRRSGRAPRPAGQQDPGGVGRVERDAQRARQVVAGPQRQQAERADPADSSPRRCSVADRRCTDPSPPATTSRPAAAAVEDRGPRSPGSAHSSTRTSAAARRTASAASTRLLSADPADAFVTTSNRFK